METAIVNIIWMAMLRLRKTVSSLYWTINSRSSSSFDNFMSARIDSNILQSKISSYIYCPSAEIRPDFSHSSRHQEGNQSWYLCRANDRTFHPFLWVFFGFFSSFTVLYSRIFRVLISHLFVSFFNFNIPLLTESQSYFKWLTRLYQNVLGGFSNPSQNPGSSC